MTAVSIHREKDEADIPRFCAVAGKRQSLGRTPGEALDALNAQLGESESGSLIIIQQMQSDPYFSEEQYLRMRQLLDRRDSLSDTEREELESLVKAELVASAQRTQALADALGR
jgi:hypothetical protein